MLCCVCVAPPTMIRLPRGNRWGAELIKTCGQQTKKTAGRRLARDPGPVPGVLPPFAPMRLLPIAVALLAVTALHGSRGELISQSVTNLPAPSPVEAYQLDQSPSLGVSLALTFQELLKQKRFGNRVDQCPCIALPGSLKCIAYDGRYQAALTEEAMLSFVDVSMDPRIFEQRMGAGQITYWTLECHTEECRQCAGMLTVRLRQVGLLREMPQFPFPVPSPSELRPLGCPRIRISRYVPHFPPPPTPPPSIGQLISAGAPLRANLERAQHQSQFGQKVQQALSLNRASGGQPLISLLGGASQRRSTAPLSFGLPSSRRRMRRPPPSQGQASSSWVDRDIIAGGGDRGRQRPQKRQAPPSRGEPLIGERYVINCVERGEAESDHTDLLNLCTACWTWRQLPEDYFPRLINELVCQESDFCLSGWGICHQRYRNFDVLQRVRVNGQEEWRPTTISAASCCDCKVKAGSQAHALVVGGRS